MQPGHGVVSGVGKIRTKAIAMSPKGKVAVVTGASGGIGRAIALRRSRDRALVCVNYHSNAESA